MDDSVIICDEVIKSYEEDVKAKYNKANFSEKETTCKMPNFYILFSFLLITIALLIPVGIYYYLMKFQGKKHLTPFHFVNSKLKGMIY